MINSTTRNVILFAALFFSMAAVGIAQEKAIKRAPIQHTSPASGVEMYKSYCAVCHGKDAKGGGPAASELKVQPPDLTSLSKRHDGKFPAEYVANVLRNGTKAPAHGSSEMPVWGPLFSSISKSNQAVVNMRISNLIAYLESVQSK